MSLAWLNETARGEFQASGDLTFESIMELLEESQPLLAARREATIDLSAIGRADSAAIALLVEWRRRARLDGRTLRFRGLPQSLRDLLELSELTELLD